MADGNLKLSPSEARQKANDMVKKANEIENLLNEVSKKIEEINNVETGTYQNDNGASSPAELRTELDEFRAIFNKAYEQITKSADDIVKIANTMEQE